MRSNHEPEMRFWMALYGKDIDLAGIEGLLRIKLDNNRIEVPDDLPEDPDGPVFYEEIAWLLDLVEIYSLSLLLKIFLGSRLYRN